MPSKIFSDSFIVKAGCGGGGQGNEQFMTYTKFDGNIMKKGGKLVGIYHYLGNMFFPHFCVYCIIVTEENSLELCVE